METRVIHFLGTSYAAVTLKEAARRRGLSITDKVEEANLIFISQDTPTDKLGNRNVKQIIKLIKSVRKYSCPKVVTSQVSPGFMRKYAGECYHQAETLRIEDGMQRAMYPEMFIIGMACTHSSYDGADELPWQYKYYLGAFNCPILTMNCEEAEFCKIAINMRLISQVESTNLLSQAAEKVGADWGKIAQALRHDSRIGKYSYLTPGDWRKSKHLLRDYVTLNEIL